MLLGASPQGAAWGLFTAVTHSPLPHDESGSRGVQGAGAPLSLGARSRRRPPARPCSREIHIPNGACAALGHGPAGQAGGLILHKGSVNLRFHHNDFP